MRKIYVIILVALLLNGCVPEKHETKVEAGINVAVSILPQKAFVEAVAGDKVNVVTMIPPGASPSNYQPTAKQMQQLSDADIYFTIDVPAEKSFITPKLGDLNKDIRIIDLFDEVAKEYEPRSFDTEQDQLPQEEHNHDGDNSEENNEIDEHEDHEHKGLDPHIWMSPKRVKVMVDAIADTFSQIDPSNAQYYKNNADNYKSQLDDLDTYIKTKLNEAKGQPFIIYHPSLGYFADDYGLEMIAIEVSGKEANAKEIEKVIDYAKDKNIHIIFYQAEFSSKQAEIIADEIDGTVIKVDLLTENYIDNMKAIADSMARK